MPVRTMLAGVALAALAHPALALEAPARTGLTALIAAHAKANGVPEDLVHRIIRRESRYDPSARGRGGAMGLMQIKHATARALGYDGTAAGLLDADTNLAYGVRYLAGAYRVAKGDPSRAVSLYASGYYYEAKRRGMLQALKGRPEEPAAAAAAEAEEAAAPVEAARYAGALPPAEGSANR